MIDFHYFAGGLPRDAELRYTPSGRAVASFTLAQSNSVKDEQTGEWEKKNSSYLNVTMWNADRGSNPVPWAEIAGGLKKGDQVVVLGRLETRSWEDKDGNKRSVLECQARELYVRPAVPQSSGGGPKEGPFSQQNDPWGGFGASNPGDEQPPF